MKARRRGHRWAPSSTRGSIRCASRCSTRRRSVAAPTLTALPEPLGITHARHPLRPGPHRARAERAGAGGLGARRVGELLSRVDGDRRRTRARSRRSAPTTPSSAFRCRPARTKVSLDFQDPAYRTGKTVTLVAMPARARWRCGAGARSSTADVSSEPVRERALVIVPTYNERENIRRLDRRRPRAGRAHRDARRRRRLARRHRRRSSTSIAAADPRVHVLAARAEAGAGHRLPRRLPLGARARLRLRPRDGRRLLARSRRTSRSSSRAIEDADLVLGSRYQQGRVTVVNWPIGRLLLSYFGEPLRARRHRPAGVGRDRRLQVLSPGRARGDRPRRTCDPTATRSRSR